MKMFTVSIILMLTLSGCLLESVGPINRTIKPYGAHWFKDGMTREGRLNEFTQCGGYGNMREGYEIQPNQSTTDFFKGYNAHVTKVAACMRAKSYTYLEQCDARCLHP